MNAALPTREVLYTDFHLFCGIGGGALGFKRARARIGALRARTRCLGGIDVDAGAVTDFRSLTGARGTVLDLFTTAQYIEFHGKAPPAGWREAQPVDLLEAAGWEHPDIVFTSPPCKGLSGLLSKRSARSRKYRALNRLTVRGIDLMLRAFAEQPPRLILLENVPRIRTRGRALLDAIVRLLEAHGYAVAETTHDCGQLGGLAQHRRRFLLVARHRERVPPFLYEPPQQRVRAVGEVLGELPMPGDPTAGPMHKLSRLQWRTWVRLALIPAGGDWRSLNKLDVRDGFVQGLALQPGRWFPGVLGVKRWTDTGATVTGNARSTTGAYSVADPRCGTSHQGNGKYRTAHWEEPSGTVIAASDTGYGAYSVADPRYEAFGQHHGKMRVEDWDRPAHTVTGSDRVGSGALSIADPRAPRDLGAYQPYGVVHWDDTGRTVTGQAAPGAGPYSVADPRLACDEADTKERRYNNVYRVVRWEGQAPCVTGASGNSRTAIADPRFTFKAEGDAYSRGRQYGVIRWGDSSPCVTGNMRHDTSAACVADVRLPKPTERCTPLIVALDGSWHRPLTTLELAALQSFPVLPSLALSGKADRRWRGRIGNAVPPEAARAIGSTMLETLLMADLQVSKPVANTPVWVRPFCIALSVAQRGEVRP